MTSQSPQPLLAKIAAANARYQETFRWRDLSNLPAERVFLLGCMDARFDKEAFGLELGEANIFRNAGARLTEDAMRSLIVAQQRLGVNTVIIATHTDCGLAQSTRADILGSVRRNLGAAALRQASDFEFFTFTDPYQALRADLAKLREVPWLAPGTTLIGAVYHVSDGRVEIMVVDSVPQSGSHSL